MHRVSRVVSIRVLMPFLTADTLLHVNRKAGSYEIMFVDYLLKNWCVYVDGRKEGGG